MRVLVRLLLVGILIISCRAEEESEVEGRRKNEDIACLEQCEQGSGNMKNVAGKDSVEATNIAQKAAQEAKAAESAQLQAAQQAAHQVKEQLADKAVEAAKAAKAALAGKEIIVDELSEEIKQSEIVEAQETDHIQSLSGVKDASTKSLQDARAEAKILAQLLHIVDSNIQDAEKVEQGLVTELNEKQQLVDQAKHRKEELGNEMSKAKADLQKTRTAAVNAEAAASEAKQNVQKARKRKRSLFGRRRK